MLCIDMSSYFSQHTKDKDLEMESSVSFASSLLARDVLNFGL